MADVKLITAAQLNLPVRAVGRSSGTIGDTRFGTAGDAARICGVSLTTVRNWAARGKIVGVERRGRTWRFDLAEIRRLRDSKDLTWLNGQPRSTAAPVQDVDRRPPQGRPGHSRRAGGS